MMRLVLRSGILAREQGLIYRPIGDVVILYAIGVDCGAIRGNGSYRWWKYGVLTEEAYWKIYVKLFCKWLGACHYWNVRYEFILSSIKHM